MLNRAREAEAIIPWREQNPRERFRQGEPIRAVLKVLEETPRGPRLVLSRADPQFVAALFALEVPEIYQGKFGVDSQHLLIRLLKFQERWAGRLATRVRRSMV